MKIERRAERALANSRGRGIPRASAFMRLFCQPASTRTEERGDIEVPGWDLYLYGYTKIYHPIHSTVLISMSTN